MQTRSFTPEGVPCPGRAVFPPVKQRPLALDAGGWLLNTCACRYPDLTCYRAQVADAAIDTTAADTQHVPASVIDAHTC